MRRLWPESLVSWNRLLAGRWRDPLVASSILAGLALGVATELVDQIDILASLHFFPHDARITSFWIYVPDASAPTLATLLLSSTATALSFAMFGLLILVLLRLVLRSQALAAAAYGFVSWAIYHEFQSVPYANWLCHIVLGLAMFLVFTRFGLLGGVVFWFVHLLATLPLSLNMNDWYSPFAFGALAMVAILAVYGVRTVTIGSSSDTLKQHGNALP